MSSFFQRVLANFKKEKGSSHFECTILMVLHRFRYTNVDYVVIRSTQHNPEPKKIASYDIMCQWSKNLWRCLSEFPLNGVEHLDDKIVAQVVPKFYLAAHCQEGHANYSLNYEPSAGWRDMEGPE